VKAYRQHGFSFAWDGRIDSVEGEVIAAASFVKGARVEGILKTAIG
jgi:hypothetical protein